MSEIQVPDDYPTIQQAINAANNDDVVIIGAGTWGEGMNVHSSDNIQINSCQFLHCDCPNDRAGAYLSTPAGGLRTSGGSNLDLTTIPPGPMVLLTSGTLTRDFTTRQHWKEVLELWFALGNPR
jgi:hypothetical protein